MAAETPPDPTAGETPPNPTAGGIPPPLLLSPSQAYEAERKACRPALPTRAGEEIVAWVKTFASAAVYATLIVVFAFRSALATPAGAEIAAWVKTFASAAIYAILIVNFGFQVARVEGRSMEPTLEDRDRLIVNKALYQFFGEPEPGDIVMLSYPLDPEKSFVKRVIAQAGDEVRIEEGNVYVNDVLLPDEYVPPRFRSHESLGPERVQAAHYFVMGDHRNSSSDSRHWGQVPKGYVIGKVHVRWWPPWKATIF